MGHLNDHDPANTRATTCSGSFCIYIAISELTKGFYRLLNYDIHHTK